MLGLGLSLQKGVSAFNAGRALVSSYIRRVTDAGGVLQNTACDVAAINELNQDRLLEPASWVLVPDGIKEDVVYAQKPSTGLGDLTFTRASDATYTDASGVVRRSPYNLFQYSEMFTDASWTKLNSATTANVTTAPNGTFTADKLALIAGINPLATDGTGLSQSIAVNSGIYTYSIYLKAAERNIARWRDGGSTGQYLVVNLNDGTFTNGAPARFQNVQVNFVGNGWYRVQFTTGTITNPNVYPLRFGDTGQTGDGTSGGFIWGAQLVEGTSALDYFPTTNRQDVPRIDFRNADGTLSTCGRLLLEPQRTNSIRNSSMVGAVAGSPGTLPTNWTQNGGGGLTRTIVGTGTENGLPYIDLRYNGTASQTFLTIIFENAISASASQAWSSSLYIKLIAGSLPTCRLEILPNAGSVQSTIVTPTSLLNRASLTYASLPGGTTTVANYLALFPVLSTAYDFTIRIAAPQMELGGYATTWVPTTTAAVTRLADVAIKTGVSSLIGQTEGTMFIEVNTSVLGNVFSGTSRRFLTISDNTLNNRIIIIQSLSNDSIQFSVVSGGVEQASILTSANQSGIKKIAAAYANNDFVLYINGVQIGADTSGTVPACSRLAIGVEIDFVTANPACPVAQAALFPTRLTNDQLEVLTSEGYGNYALLAESLNYVLQ